MSKKGNFDGLCKQTVGKYFQKKKVSEFSTEKIFPKREILMDYVIRSWENISKKGYFDGLCNHIISYSNESHKLALQHGYYSGILNGLLKQVTKPY